LLISILGENDDTDRPRLEREPTQLSDDFERHTQIPRDSDFAREERPDINNEQDDMNDPTLDKAATRIQASYRGYKTRKELSSGGSQDLQQDPSSTSPHTHDEYDHVQNKSKILIFIRFSYSFFFDFYQRKVIKNQKVKMMIMQLLLKFK
jgi:hypothetical protein